MMIPRITKSCCNERVRRNDRRYDFSQNRKKHGYVSIGGRENMWEEELKVRQVPIIDHSA